MGQILRAAGGATRTQEGEQPPADGAEVNESEDKETKKEKKNKVAAPTPRPVYWVKSHPPDY